MTTPRTRTRTPPKHYAHQSQHPNENNDGNVHLNANDVDLGSFRSNLRSSTVVSATTEAKQAPERKQSYVGIVVQCLEKMFEMKLGDFDALVPELLTSLLVGGVLTRKEAKRITWSLKQGNILKEVH